MQEAIDSIQVPKFAARLVSDADEIGVIQKRIVQAVYNSDIVICDVSGKNPNVMFELGLRLAFDRPTVIIKDDKTDYSFDTGVIEHISYPRDLRFAKIVAFKKQLAEKVTATYTAAQQPGEHSTFLKSFGTFKVASLEQKEASGDQLVLDMMQDVQRELAGMRRQLVRGKGREPSQMADAALIAALIALKKADPALSLDVTDELVNLVIEKQPGTTGPYDSKRAYEEGIRAACEIVRLVSG